jgi:hypothetical protein
MILLVVLWTQCATNQKPKKGGETTHQTLDLVVNKDDWAVKTALMNDSIYTEIEKYLMDEKKMNLERAEDEIQSMIDNKLVDKPTLNYYDSNGELQMKVFKYTEFKRYVSIVKDSVKKQTTKN